jgi:hypothetical protein
VAARAEGRHRTHVPYRNSTLTYLLQDALAGTDAEHRPLAHQPHANECAQTLLKVEPRKVSPGVYLEGVRASWLPSFTFLSLSLSLSPFSFAMLRVFRPSGDSKMAFIVCISAAAANADETTSSLVFATRAVTVQQAKAHHKHTVAAAGGGSRSSSSSSAGGSSPARDGNAAGTAASDGNESEKPKARAPWMEKK